MIDLQPFMSTYYHAIHGPIVLCVCTFGIATQTLNVAILTRRPMRKMPSNIILAGLSVAQLILLTNYIMGTIYELLDHDCYLPTKSSHWLTYLLINVNANVVFHTIALVQTTMLAVFRYAAVAFPLRCRHLISDRGAKLTVALAFLTVPIACSTFYPNSAIVQQSNTNGTGMICSFPDDYPIYRLRYTENRFLRDYNFIFFGTVCKLLPCALMIILSALLIYELKRVRLKRELMMNGGDEKMRQLIALNRKHNSQLSNNSLDQNHRHQRQTTIMLVTVVLLLACVEFPQGVMNFLAAILDDYEFSVRIYAPLGDFFEMLTVLYSSVNFIIYCAMSSEFRKIFKRLFGVKHAQRRASNTLGTSLAI